MNDFSQGSIVAQRGPSFLDLQIITHSNMESASFFFTAGSVGYLVGSLLAGVIYDKINKSFLLIGLVLGLSLTTIALPWCSLYGLMITAFFFCSLFGGGLDTGSNDFSCIMILHKCCVFSLWVLLLLGCSIVLLQWSNISISNSLKSVDCLLDRKHIVFKKYFISCSTFEILFQIPAVLMLFFFPSCFSSLIQTWSNRLTSPTFDST